MSSFGAAEHTDVYEHLAAAYSEAHRHYHTAAHIDDCLAQLDRVRSLADAAHEVELALWFHDAVYDPSSVTNEEDSAAWAGDFLRSMGAAEDRRMRIFAYVMATKHEAEPPGGDATLVVDIDLSILGRDAEEYDRFERNIRMEYKWVPRPLYRRKRSEVLASFLRRPRIYGSEYFREQYEERARSNLERAIEALSR